MESWPSTLPQYVDQDAYTETILDPVIRTEMDAGPSKARLRYTAVPEQFTITLKLTAEQRAVFVYFYKYTLNYGVDEFYWYHPTSTTDSERDVVVCRFISVYTISSNGNEFEVSFNMEVEP